MGGREARCPKKTPDATRRGLAHHPPLTAREQAHFAAAAGNLKGHVSSRETANAVPVDSVSPPGHLSKTLCNNVHRDPSTRLSIVVSARRARITNYTTRGPETTLAMTQRTRRRTEIVERDTNLGILSGRSLLSQYVVARSVQSIQQRSVNWTVTQQ